MRVACSMTAQDVHALAGHRHDFEEIGRKDGFCLGPQKRRPAGRGACGCRVDAGVVEDLPHGGRRDFDAQDEQLAVDTPIPPRAVFPREAQDEQPDRPHGARPADSLRAGDPSVVCGNQVAVLTQHRVWAHQQPHPMQYLAGKAM
jgi:hypothetical protein